MTDKWDKRMLELARLCAGWSKDPSMKVGAVIADSGNNVVSQGYNGFPKGMTDDPAKLADKDYKLKYTIHAETHALLKAGTKAVGCTIYIWPIPPCPNCVAMLMQAGITKVVIVTPDERQVTKYNFKESTQLMKNANINLMIEDI